MTEQTVLVEPEQTEPKRPDDACFHFSICGNMSAGNSDSNSAICDDCLDAVRERSREIDAQKRDQFSDEDVADSETYLQTYHESS